MTALLLGLAGVVASGRFNPSLARDRGDSYENHGAKPGLAPPVPGSALWMYQPGMCWKFTDSNRQQGRYIPCSEFFKKKRT